MRKKRQFWAFIGLAICCLLLLGVVYRQYQREEERQSISRAQAAKSIALIFADKEQLLSYQDSFFSEKDQGMWYVKYMDFMYREGYFLTEQIAPGRKEAGNSLTIGEFKTLLEQMEMEVPDHGIFAEKYERKSMSKDSFWEYYERILSASNQEEVFWREILIYGTPANMDGIDSWSLYTDEEILGFEGLAMDAYIDCKVGVYIRGKEIAGVKGVVAEQVLYENLWIIENSEKELKVYLNGKERSFFLTDISQDISGYLADIEVEKGQVTKIDLKNDRIKGKVLAIGEDFIEVEGYGRVPLAEKFRVFKTYGTFSQKHWDDILVGYDVYDFITAAGEICGGIIREDIDAKIIRVLLTDTGFQSVFHNQIRLSGSEGFQVSWDNGNEIYEAGEVLEFTISDEMTAQGRLVIEPLESGELTVLSVERAYGNPSYEGRIEISTVDEGLLIVNELPLEKYLKRVVPSEMPASFGVESLKVQAVCARSYAYRQIQGNSYSSYGAHVDDSTKFQVYNNILEQEASNQAIDETYGQVLTFEDEVITAYYFSTSCGATADALVWGSERESFPYLPGGVLSSSNSLDLSNEADFKEFILDWEYATYDTNSAWFRWRTELKFSELSEKVAGIGEITSIEVINRGTGGIVLEMMIYGTEGDYHLQNQNQIREVLAHRNQVIDKKDGTQATNWNRLPSAFLYLEPSYQDNQLSGYILHGGGYGHGVGMSQWAVPEMVRQGFKYDEILGFFYLGTSILEL